MSLRNSSGTGFLRQRWVWIGGLLLLLIAGLWFGAGVLLERYLESSKLRTLVSAKTAGELKAPTGFLPLEWRGLSVHSAGALASRDGGKGLQEMCARDLSARCNLMEMWRGKWRIELLTIGHLQAAFGTHAKTRLVADLPSRPSLDQPAEKGSPFDVAIQETHIPRTALWWGDEPKSSGGFSEVETRYFVDGKNLRVHGKKGTFHQTGWPEASVGSFRLYYARPHLRIDEGTLTLQDKGVIGVLGAFEFSEKPSMDLRLDFKQCPIAAFVKPELRKKIGGVFNASAQLRRQFANKGPLSAAGELSVASGELKAFQALNQLAAFTGKPELRELSIDRLEGNFDWNTPTLKVSGFRFESKGVVSVRGQFTVEKGSIAGEFRLGAAPEIVEKFPGAREEVFTGAEGGYLWTTVNVAGPLKKPRLDLKPRLVAAAQKHFAKGFLAPILKPGSNVIDAINSLFD